jgi:ribose-phosphate pyrophosphokinase
MSPAITFHAFAPDLTPATALAAALGYPCHSIDRHSFPDGESLVRVEPPAAAAIVYCRLDRPNDKLIELLPAADALTQVLAWALERTSS